MNGYPKSRLGRHYDIFLYHNVHLYYCQRICIALAYYKLKYSSQEINYFDNEHFKPWFLRLNPDSTLPVLRQGNLILVNTLTTIEYLENYMKSDIHLLPLEHFHKIKRFMELIDSINMHVLRYYVLSDPELNKNSKIPEIIKTKELDNFEKVDTIINEYSTKYKDLLVQYSNILDRYNSYKAKIKDKIYMDGIFIILEKVLDDIEAEMADGALHESNRLAVKQLKVLKSQPLPIPSALIKKPANEFQPLINPSNQKFKHTRSKTEKVDSLVLHKEVKKRGYTQFGSPSATTNKSQQPANGDCPHVTIAIPAQQTSDQSSPLHTGLSLTSPMTKNGDGRTPLWLCRTRDLTAADIWLIVLLHELDILGLADGYWNGKGLRPHINNYYKLVKSYLKPPANDIFTLYGGRDRGNSLVDHKTTRACVTWFDHHIIKPILHACFGVRAPTRRHYRAAYWGLGLTFFAVGAASIGLVYYYLYFREGSGT